MRRFVLSASIVVIGLALWLLPEMSAWLERKPDEAWARMQQSGVIRFAINPVYMPFDGLGSHGDFFGIDVDIANEIWRGAWASAPSLSSPASTACMMFCVWARPRRRSRPCRSIRASSALWAYSEPYFEAGQVMVAKPARSGQAFCAKRAEPDLAGFVHRRRVRFRRGCGSAVSGPPSRGYRDQVHVIGGRGAQGGGQWLGGCGHRRWRQRQTVVAEVSGTADRRTSDPRSVCHRHVGREHQLLEAINAKLAEMKQDGTLERIVDEWMKK